MSTMEQIHGIDVSWMTHGSPKDKTAKPTPRRNTLPSQHRRQSAISSPPPPSPLPGRLNGYADTAAADGSTPPRQAAAAPTTEKPVSLPSTPQRRGSWFSNISSRFSSSPGQSPPQTTNTAAKPGEISVPKANPAKNAVLQHAARYEGDGPYTPAPPKSGQAGLFQVFRRLSSSSGQPATPVRGTHGLVERKVLNVDPRRERCALKDLNSAKLRRVAFCVDVEIAPLPRYADEDAPAKKAGDKTQKRKFTEKGEGDVLRNAKLADEKDDQVPANGAAGEITSKEPSGDGGSNNSSEQAIAEQGEDTSSDKPRDASKKKEKKKKSEEERKARKEKKRRLEVANGSKPMEIFADSDSSVPSTPTVDTAPRAPPAPPTNPVRVYRRCCQLRETPILKKITEQLMNPANFNSDQGVVEKLDLTGYWLQLPDLVTLGDYLAVVPIKELLLENCGLTDEGLRVVLAGLLAAKKTELRPRGGETNGFVQQGGVIERLVLKNNKIGPEGWKHICLFIYMCRSLTVLDISSLSFPQAPVRPRSSQLQSQQPPAQPAQAVPDSQTTRTTQNGQTGQAPEGASVLPPREPLSISQLLSKSIGERLGGPTLELLNLGGTGINTEQLGLLVDGLIQCGISRLGLANNSIDEQGLKHVARYLRSGKCEGLDLGGNDIGERLGIVADAIKDDHPLWALSLADCGLKPVSLSKLFPKLTKLKAFRFIDLSHNHDLFRSEPSAISLLRRYLPKMEGLKRIHLADVAMNPEQAIALAEILPEVGTLAHINLLENPELAKLADAKTEAAQEEACALFASLLAATRVSTSIVAVDIDVPTEQSGEIVRAMAKQVVAYCLRNMERLPLGKDAVGGLPALLRPDPEYPDVIQHLVGHDVMLPDEAGDVETAPDDDYVIGGTGVVKALACCLKNRGDDFRRGSGEFSRDVGSGTVTPQSKLPAGKAKDMSKHLLGSARKIRLRLQPALEKARAASGQDIQAYSRLQFLDNTLDGIIKRFEDEFPETRVPVPEVVVTPDAGLRAEQQLDTSAGPAEVERETPPAVSDVEDEVEFVPSGVGRSNSVISLSSRGLTNEEGRAFRVGHKFRSGMVKISNVLSGVEEIGADPNHSRVLHELLDEVNDDKLKEKVGEKGIVRVFQEDREQIIGSLRAADPEHWERFIESQKMARANVLADADGRGPSNAPAAQGGDGVVVGSPCEVVTTDEEAIAED